MKKIYMLLFAIMFLGVEASQGQGQVTVLHSFTNNEPYYGNGVIIVKNLLYGITEEGGVDDKGVIFSMNRDGSNYKTLYSFTDTGSHAGNCSGEYPYCNLTYVNGKLYGCTYEGGFNGYGTLFSVNLDGSGYKDLWDFASATGEYPYQGSLTVYGNKFFGTTEDGGANGYGVVFSIDTNGAGYKDIWDFDDTVSNGEYPYNLTLATSKGKLYGTAESGGRHGYGLVFSIDTNGTHYKDLYDFNSTDTTGEYPYGSVVLSGNKLYGTTEEGTSEWGYGTIYSLDTNGTGYTLMHYFEEYGDGAYPYCTLAMKRGRLYGTTYEEGPDYESYGTLYSIDSTGGNFTLLNTFDEANGYYPYGGVTIGGDTLYGMTEYGGLYDDGEVYNLVDTRIVASTETVAAPAVNSAVSVYPNPNNGQFTVICNSQGNEAMNIEVYNVLGEQVYTGKLQNTIGNNQVNLGSQSNGVYLYRITTEAGSLVSDGKIVLEK